MSSIKSKEDQAIHNEEPLETPARDYQENFNEFAILSPQSLVFPENIETPLDHVDQKGRSFHSHKGVKKVTVLNKN